MAIVVFAQISLTVEAGCLNFIKRIFFEKKETVARQKLEEHQEVIERKDKEFTEEVDAMRLGGMLSESKLRGTTITFESFLKENIGPKEIKELLEIAYKNIERPEVLVEWLRDLYKESFVEIYKTESSPKIMYFERRFRIPEAIMLKVLLRRLEQLGFPKQEPRRLDSVLSDAKFGEMLGNKELFIDQAFKGTTHGHYIHLWQLDFLGFLSKKHNLRPTLVSEAYSWMGKSEKLQLSTNKTIDPLSDGWFTIFDSREASLSRPEHLNPLVETYMGW